VDIRHESLTLKSDMTIGTVVDFTFGTVNMGLAMYRWCKVVFSLTSENAT